MNLSMGPERVAIATVPVCAPSLVSGWRLNFQSRLPMALISDDSVNSICSSGITLYFKKSFKIALLIIFAGSLIKSCHRGICYLGEWLLDISQIVKIKGGRPDIYAYKEWCRR